MAHTEETLMLSRFKIKRWGQGDHERFGKVDRQ